jgi:hypothetical protein
MFSVATDTLQKTTQALAFGWLQALHALITLWQRSQEDAMQTQATVGQSEVLNTQWHLDQHTMNQSWQTALDKLLPLLEEVLQTPAIETLSRYAALWHEVKPSLEQALLSRIPQTPWTAPQRLGYTTFLETLHHVQPGVASTGQRSDFWPYTGWLLTLTTCDTTAAPVEVHHTEHGILQQHVSPFLITTPCQWLVKGTTAYTQALARILWPILQARHAACGQRLEAFKAARHQGQATQTMSDTLAQPSLEDEALTMLHHLLGVALWGVAYVWGVCHQAWQAAWAGDTLQRTWLQTYEPLLYRAAQRFQDMPSANHLGIQCLLAWRSHWQVLPPTTEATPYTPNASHDALWGAMVDALEPLLTQYPFNKALHHAQEGTSANEVLAQLIKRFEEGILPCATHSTTRHLQETSLDTPLAPDASQYPHWMHLLKESPASAFDMLQAYVLFTMQAHLAQAPEPQAQLLSQCQDPLAFQEGYEGYAWRLSLLHKALETTAIHQALSASSLG